jgi:diguanylate cyclase
MSDDLAAFQHLARPLLELIQRLTGLETSFVTEIDWDTQKQLVLVASNTATLEVAEGTVVNWSDSMCRLSFLSDKAHTSDVPGDFPGSIGAEQIGMRTFFALPILIKDVMLGSVCGASGRAVEIGPEVLSHIGLIAQAMAFQMTAHMDSLALRERAEQAEALARMDPLTGLANRRGFTSRFEEELANSARHGSPLAVLAIDVDRFKVVNDTYGHPGGDIVLAAAGDVLRRSAGPNGVAARIGGDEFAVLLPHCDTEGAELVVAQITADFAVAMAEVDMSCTLSIGVSTSATTPRLSLLTTADKSLYIRKASRLVNRPALPSGV